jgi:S-(hydroxymethyl)glutathione dehydrogenase/alcohol dehydrogenase
VNGTMMAVPPIVLGHEGAGVIEEVGEGVTNLKPGDHVVISWVPQCGDCFFCSRDQGYLCEGANAALASGGLLDGTTRMTSGGAPLSQMAASGTFGEVTIVPASGAVKIPDDLDMKVAALIGCGVLTGTGAALNTANIRKGDTVVVIGCGGVGLSIVQGARMAGAARIVACDLDPAKLAVAARVGATETLEARDTAAALREAVPEGLDFVFDAVGRIETTEQAIAAVGLGGAAVIVGLPPVGQAARFDPLALAEASQRILGSNYGSVDPQRDVPWLVDRAVAGDLNLEALVSGRRPLAEAAEALDDLRAGRTLRTLLIPDAAQEVRHVRHDRHTH